MELRYKIWLDQDGKAFGVGPSDILKRVDRLNSLSKAAREINMSYSQAWGLINNLEARLGFKLLEREVGGSYGGGSSLTADAHKLIRQYDDFLQEADRELKDLFKKHFDKN
ncbi:MAG: hypothetical protein VR67_03100 [Peptococcaceae bacterium BRH_c8a]|nr:MAG: hypothetical protein VR67_03100 [Peptococcaceae bacterium BRH_c8a]